jgi:dihydroorotate dehydrogenase
MYSLIRNILFLFEAEKAHYISMNMLKMVCSVDVFKKIVRALFSSNHPSLNRKVFGLHFKNPIGLGAGFDKNASYLRELETLGFGFVEIGTVTPLPQEGNEKPRLFRLPEDKALINRMGFNNDGVKTIKSRLEQWKRKNEAIPDGKRMIIGGNIGKNKNTPNEEAWKDYEICFTELFDVVDYFVVNVSSPNTPGLRALQDKDALTNILQRLQNLNNLHPKRKPLLLKIAPDLTTEQLQDIAEISSTVKLDGIVSSNTTISRENLSNPSQIAANKIGMGGLSGKPLKNASDAVLKQLIKLTNGKIPIIASGGIFTAKDAEDKIELGASLIQVWTGFIYEGPGLVKTISKNLIK